MNLSAWFQAHRSEALLGGGVAVGGIALIARSRAKKAGGASGADTSTTASGVPVAAGGVPSSSQDAIGWLQPQLDSLASAEGQDAALLKKLSEHPNTGLTSTQLQAMVQQALVRQELSNLSPKEKAAFNRWVRTHPAQGPKQSHA